MSAFICDDKTITCIAKAFFEYGVKFKAGEPKSDFDLIIVNRDKEIKRIGQALLDANYKSVNFRYKEDTETPDFIPEEVDIDEGKVLGCIACFDYQACETKEYYESQLYKDLQNLKTQITYRLLKRLEMPMPYGYNGHDMLDVVDYPLF